MFHITNELFLSNSLPVMYQKGEEFYRQRKIKSIHFSQEQLLFQAVINDINNYEVNVAFKESGALNYARCTCPAYKGYMGFCKHIIAVLLVIKGKDEQGFFGDLRSKKAVKQVFNYFQSKPMSLKTPLKLEITYELNRGSNYGMGAFSSLGLRTGEDRLYIVRDIKRFLRAVKRNEELEFGKGFTYDPAVHFFKPDDRRIIDLLMELYDFEELSDRFYQNLNKTSIFREKQVLLAPSAVKRLFDIIGGRTFRAVIQGNIYEEIAILQGDFPLEFKLSKDGNELVLDIKFDNPLIPITEDCEYCFVGGKIYRSSKKQQENFKPFYSVITSFKGTRIRFPEEESERFVSEILPYAGKAGQLRIEEDVKAVIQELELEAELFLDHVEGGIIAELKFIYGDRTINPFASSEKASKPEGRILLRDTEKERLILGLLEESEFKVKNGQVYLEGEECIFGFVYNTLPKLQEYVRVFYSEDFKSMNIRSGISFLGGIRLNSDTNMLEFSFSMDGIDRPELFDIFGALKEKKKYYRLKDGSFILLDRKEMTDMAGLVEYLDLKREDFEKDCIEVSRYRALYLDQYLKNSKVGYIERNHSFREFVQNVQEPADTDIKVPRSLKGVLREYQKFGFKWLKTLAHYGLGGILADDMGLGKTLQLISLILSDREEKGVKPSLVIVPTSLVYNWYAEIQRFAPVLNVVLISGNREERLKQVENIDTADIVITSYPLIRRDIEEYAGLSFRYCILDEAQNIKNPNSQNAKSVKEIKAENRFALTGTPMENSLTELWSIFDFILPGYLFSHSRFVQDYERPIVRDGDKKAGEELNRHIRPFILRRMKNEVLNELPDKIESKMIAELTDEQKAVYISYLQKVRSDIEKEINERGFEKSRIFILSALTRLRQICCHPSTFLEGFEGESGKMLLLQEIVGDCMEGGHRVLIFSQFTGMLRIIEEWLKSEGIEYFYLDGGVKAEERAGMVKAFNSGRRSIFLISLKAGGTGLNLTGADTVIHFDPWWNPAVEEQATDRAYRIGQNKAVQVMKLITRGTIEEKIFDLQEKKRKLIDTVIQPGETLMTKMSEEEVRALFE